MVGVRLVWGLGPFCHDPIEPGGAMAWLAPSCEAAVAVNRLGFGWTCLLLGPGTGHVPRSAWTCPALAFRDGHNAIMSTGRRRKWTCPAFPAERHSPAPRDGHVPRSPRTGTPTRTREWACPVFPGHAHYPQPGMDMSPDPHGHAHPSCQRMGIVPLCPSATEPGGHAHWGHRSPADKLPSRA